MEANAELLALQRLDETCTHLQKQGNYLEALECMERGLVLRQHFFGAESEEVCAIHRLKTYFTDFRYGTRVKLLVNYVISLQ